jgi:hypothetical protein
VEEAEDGAALPAVAVGSGVPEITTPSRELEEPIFVKEDLALLL